MGGLFDLFNLGLLLLSFGLNAHGLRVKGQNRSCQSFTSALGSQKDSVFLPAAAYICRASTLGRTTRLCMVCMWSAGVKRHHVGVPSKINLL